MKLYRKGQGAPLLLLHCLGVDHRLWDIAAAGLESKYTLLSVDFPGHGEAPLADEAYGVEDLADQVATLLQEDGVTRVHVAGISLGGLVAQHLAASRPELVDHVALIDTTPRYTDAMRANWAVRAATARNQGVAAMTDQLLSVWFTPEAVTADTAAVRYVRDCFARCSGEGYARACEALAAADLRDGLPRIKAPALVILGEDDGEPFRVAAKEMEAQIPSASIVWLAPARHASILEQPAAFTAAMERFLAT